MIIKEIYNFSLLTRAAYTNFSAPEDVEFEKELAETTRHIAFTFANQAQANEVTDNYDFVWQYNDPLTGFSGSVFQEKSSSKCIGAFKGTEFCGSTVGGADVLVAYTGLNGFISGGQAIKTI